MSHNPLCDSILSPSDILEGITSKPCNCKTAKKWVVNIRTDKFDVYIGRRSKKWGNPFVIGVSGNREEVIALYRNYVEHNPELKEKIRKELRAKILGCHCAPLACHGDILAEIANS